MSIQRPGGDGDFIIDCVDITRLQYHQYSYENRLFMTVIPLDDGSFIFLDEC